MDASGVGLMRELLRPTGWLELTRDFGRALRRSARAPGELLLVGTPQQEPWHLAAHLDDEARLAGAPELSPVLVRWEPPPGAPAHLGVGLDRLERARRGETLFVVAPDPPPPRLLERVSDARKVGASIFCLDGGDPDLADLAHEGLVVPARLAADSPTGRPVVSVDMVCHLVSAAAGEAAGATNARSSLRRRLAALLDAVSGPPPERRR